MKLKIALSNLLRNKIKCHILLRKLERKEYEKKNNNFKTCVKTKELRNNKEKETQNETFQLVMIS